MIGKEIRINETICTDSAELSFDAESSVLYIKMIEYVHMDLKKTIAHYKLIAKITKGKKDVAFIDATNYFTIDEEALKYTALPATTEGRIATAHYTTNMANRLTANFFRKFYKPSLPVQTFTSKSEAIKWLRSYLKTEN